MRSLERKRSPVKAAGAALAATVALSANVACGDSSEPKPIIVAGYITPDTNNPGHATVDTCVTYESPDGTPGVDRIVMTQTVNGGPNLARRLTTGVYSRIAWEGDKPATLKSADSAGDLKDSGLPCSFDVSAQPGSTLPQGMGYIVLGPELVPQHLVGPYGPDTVDDSDCPPVTIEGYQDTTASSPRLGCVVSIPLESLTPITNNP